MKHLLILITIVFTFTSLAIGAELPSVNDGNPHGDPPFLLEDGWEPLINGRNMDGWQLIDTKKEGRWTATNGVYWGGPENPKQLTGVPTVGDRIINTAGQGGASNILATEKMGDMELYVEFMIPANSNAGVYVHGLYELQIWDSYGIEPRLETDKTGALYHYDGGPINGIDGAVVPLVRAERPHGQWNSYHIWFQAPRFDKSGKKTANAKFLRVLLNGQLIHMNQERLGATTAATKIPEAAENPAVMLQGDHGPVAFRNVYVRPLRQSVVK
ncbi:DUF1080 domain-containing protein [Candidatus Latescibacterota bacterium]